MALKTLDDLLVHELKDLYNAEKQLIKALPEMAKAAASQKLQAGFKNHLAETEEHVTRLETICKMLDVSPSGSHCDAMEGLIAEGKKMIEEDAESAVKDAGLIAAAQRVEHYEIAGYGVARTFAGLLGHDQAEKLLQATLDEEKATDEKLTQIAESVANVEAEQGEED